MIRLGLAVLAIAACSRSPSVTPGARDARARDEASMSTTQAPAMAPSISFAVRQVVARRPPLTELRLDVTLANPTATARWYLVPRAIDNPIGDRGVDVLETFAWSGRDRAVIGSFLGTGGFFAVHLAPRSTLRVLGLPVEWSRGDDDAARPRVTAVIAEAVTIGGKPAATWFPAGDPVVEGDRTVERSEITGSVRFRDDYAELGVELTGAERTTATLTWP